MRGKPLSRGPPRPFWGSKPHERRRPKAKWFSPQFIYPHENSRLSSNLSFNLLFNEITNRDKINHDLPSKYVLSKKQDFVGHIK